MDNFLDILSPEDIERDIFEEKMEEQKIQELLTGEAELLEKGIVGWVVCYSSWVVYGACFWLHTVTFMATRALYKPFCLLT